MYVKNREFTIITLKNILCPSISSSKVKDTNGDLSVAVNLMKKIVLA